MSGKIILSCDKCNLRNYSIPARRNQPRERLTLNKFCKHCNTHTVHKQTT